MLDRTMTDQTCAAAEGATRGTTAPELTADDLPHYLRELASHLDNKAEWLMADATIYRKAADAVAANNARAAVYRIEAGALRVGQAALRAQGAALTIALRRIAQPLNCGCLPCTGQCRSQEALQGELEERIDIASNALAALPAPEGSN